MLQKVPSKNSFGLSCPLPAVLAELILGLPWSARQPPDGCPGGGRGMPRGWGSARGRFPRSPSAPGKHTSNVSDAGSELECVALQQLVQNRHELSGVDLGGSGGELELGGGMALLGAGGPRDE